jgi:hypothetical protein
MQICVLAAPPPEGEPENRFAETLKSRPQKWILYPKHSMGVRVMLRMEMRLQIVQKSLHEKGGTGDYADPEWRPIVKGPLLCLS